MIPDNKMRKIILPWEVDNRLNNLTRLVEESAGILFYRQQGENCNVESIFMTGAGTAGKVEQIPKGIEVANIFLENNRSYKPIQFHTHSRGTLNMYGEAYAWNFSAQDISFIDEQLKQNPSYLALLATPKTKILRGNGDLRLGVSKDFVGDLLRARITGGMLERISKNLGYSFNVQVTKI